MSLRVSAIIFQLPKVIMPEKCALLTILELNWNQRFGQGKIEHLSAQLQKMVISRHRKNENVFKMSKDEKCTCKACKNTVFHCQICKFVEFLLLSSSWLLKAGSHIIAAIASIALVCDQSPGLNTGNPSDRGPPNRRRH